MIAKFVELRCRAPLYTLLLLLLAMAACGRDSAKEEAPLHADVIEEPGSENGNDAAGNGFNDDDCVADPEWVSNPSEAIAKPFNPKSNCFFHRWAYQNFLWLVSTDGNTGETIFENFGDPRRLFVEDGPGEFPGLAEGEKLKMLGRMAKSRTTADIEDIFQAGPGNKALIDQNGEVIFYSNHVNKTYWDFVKTNQLFKLDELQDWPTGTSFEVGSLELKASWRVAEKNGEVLIENADARFYVVTTEIPEVTVNERGVFVEDRSKLIPAKMALLGMHVTGVVENHPEFIWATFEHIDNAPDCAANPDDPAATGDGPTGSWSLYKAGTKTQACNQFDVSNPEDIVNVCRAHPQGGGSVDNRNAVKTLDANVHKLPLPAPWNNYMLGGAVWTGGTTTPGPSPVPFNNGAFSQSQIANGAMQLGSLDLANTTMETFTQNDNCFACHNGGSHEIVVGGGTATEVGAKDINLSHFIVNYQATQQVDSQ